MPACSTRSTAVRATLSMSISFCSSSCARYSSASGTFSLRFLRPALEEARQHVLQVDVDFLDRRAGDDLERRERLSRATSISTMRSSSRPGAQLLAQPLARRLLLLAAPAAGVLVRRATGAAAAAAGRAAAPRRSARALARTSSSRSSRTMSIAELHQVAHHRLDVAADVADLGELRRLDLDERRLREPRQPARDLGLADAGRPDHQDVLRRDLLGELRRQLLPPHAVAQRDGHGALGRAPGRRRACRARRRSGAASACRWTVCVRFGQVEWPRLSSSSIDDAARSCRCRCRPAIAIACSAIARASSSVLPRERPRRRQRVRPARSDRDDAVVGLDEVAGARQQERRRLVEHDQHRLEPAQDAIGAPVLRQLDGRALEVAAVLLELGFEAREERERVGGRPGEPGEDPVVVEAPDLLRARA